MKIRLMGTKEEINKVLQDLVKQQEKEAFNSISVSSLYENRNSVNVYRCYIDVELKK